MRYAIIDGFDHYPALVGVPGAFNTDWNAISPPSSIVLGLGGKNQAFSWGSSVSWGESRKAIPDANKLTVHFAIKLTQLTGIGSFAPNGFLRFYTSLGGHQCDIGINAAGKFVIYGEANATVATGSIPLILNQVYRCCLRLDLTTGTTAMSINGDDDPGLSHVGIDIQDDPSTNLVGIVALGYMADGFGGNTTGFTMDDLIVGLDECVDWGPLEVNTMPVSADVAVQFARSTGGTNFSCVDELPFTGDTDYNSSNTVNDKDVFDFQDAPHVPDSILAVMMMTMARKEESAVRKIREFVRIGATDYPGTEHTLAETYGRHTSVWVTNPATGLAWSAADLNGLKGGYELTQVD